MISLKQIRRIEKIKQFPNWLHDPRFPWALTFKQFKKLQTIHAQELEQNLFEKLKADWIKGYKFWMGSEYPWDKPDNMHIGVLIRKLGYQYKDHSQSGIQNNFREYIKFCMTKAPQWYKDNLDLKLISSKFAILIRLYEEQAIPKDSSSSLRAAPGEKDENIKTLAEIIPNIPIKVNQDNK